MIDWDAEYPDWPRCAIPGCSNKCCLALDSKYCWPHTPGTPEQARENLRETDDTIKTPETVT